MKRFAVTGLVWFAAVAAAQAQTVGPPQAGQPMVNIAPTPCTVSSKIGEQYLESPLAGFDPTAPGPLPVLPANSGAVMVVCSRDSIVPQVTDFRVLTEMHLPLAIKSGAKTLFIGLKEGRLQFAVPDGDATPAEMGALSARRDEMQAAMAAKVARK